MLTIKEQNRMVQCERLMHLYKEIVRNVELPEQDVEDLNNCASRIAAEWLVLSRKQGE